MTRHDDIDDIAEGEVLSVHLGHSANCSSVGSIVDFLFLSSVAGAAVVSAIAVILRGKADAAKSEASDSQPEDVSEGDDAR